MKKRAFLQQHNGAQVDTGNHLSAIDQSIQGMTIHSDGATSLITADINQNPH